MTMREAITIRAEFYIDDKGMCPFREWHGTLDRKTAEIVNDAIIKREKGNTGNPEHVADGVHELKPKGLRIYYGIDGPKLIIILGGGIKRRQQADIDAAIDRWRSYKIRKKAEQGRK